MSDMGKKNVQLVRTFFLQGTLVLQRRGPGRLRFVFFRGRLSVRRFSVAIDLGSINHCALPGRLACFCLDPDSRPMLSRRQTSALVVSIKTAVSCAVNHRSLLVGMGTAPVGGRALEVTLAVGTVYRNRAIT